MRGMFRIDFSIFGELDLQVSFCSYDLNHAPGE